MLLLFFTVSAQEQTRKQSFLMDAPDNWRKETLTLPLSFAPELDYKGLEFVRFSSGWGDKNSEEFWTYKFAWHLDVDPNITAESLNKELKIYFDGLLNLVGTGKGLTKEAIVPTKTNIIRSNSEKLFIGEVTIFDVFFTEALKILNVKVSTTYCEITKKHIAYFEFSPQPYQHKLWDIMNQIIIPCK
ncbi:hypothetical protein D7030_02860 [Flavobacteriaceae bacterium AU392]|nr:hypothetical protein D7030_02860 [Flavobacteriaceae bacterium AU392]